MKIENIERAENLVKKYKDCLRNYEGLKKAKGRKEIEEDVFNRFEFNQSSTDGYNIPLFSIPDKHWKTVIELLESVLVEDLKKMEYEIKKL